MVRFHFLLKYFFYAAKNNALKRQFFYICKTELMDSTFIKILGLVAGACTSLAILPQVVTTFKTKKASDVSMFMFIVMLTGNVLWVVYGVAKSDFAIIITNLITVALNITMLVFKVKYKENK